MAISSFANPLLEDTNADVPSLVTPLAPMTGTGLSGLGASTAGLAATGQALIRGTQPQLAVSPASPAYFSASRKEIFRKGLTFAADDAARALEAEQLPQRDIAPPAGGDWVPLNEAAYGQYIQSITQPTLGRLASKSFGRGVDIAQALAGRGLQLAGAEELGGRIVAAQEEDLRKTAPFERQFTDIESGRDAVEWFVANFAQQGPNLIESVITAGLGFMAGSAAGGPLGGAGGALAGLMGKTAFKESVKAAAKKKAAGEILTDAETKLLREAAGIAGAVTASYTQNLATGAADIYGELRDSGANADDIDARIKAIAGSIPYAALETLPEYLLASRILGGVRAPTAIPAGTSIGRRGLTVAGRGLTGFGIGGLAEGTTEAGQEALLLGLAGKELSGDEGINRLINSFAAGFAVGGPLGGVANLRGNKPANLLQPSQTAEPTSTKQELPPTIPQGAPAGTQGELFGGEPAFAGPPRPEPVSIEDRNALLNERNRLEGFIASAQRELEEAASGARTLDPARISALTSQVNAARTALTNVTQQLSQFAGLPPIVTSGAPGQLALFQPPPTGVQQLLGMRAAERQTQDILQQATVPGVPLQTGIEERLGIGRVPPVAATTALAGLQPVSTGFPSVQQALITAQEAQARQQGFEQAEAQRAAQRETEFQQMEAQAEAQRQLQLAQGQAPAAVPTPLRTVGPTEPQQLPLFGARGLPRPSGAERLRRGVRPLPEPVQVVPVTPRESLQVAGQLPMFTQEGQPSVAALRGAGKRRKVRPQLQKGARQRPAEPAAKVRAVAEKIRKRQRIDTTFDNGDQFVGLMDAEGNLISGTYSYANGDVFEGTFQENAPYNGNIVYADKSEAKFTKGEPTLTKEAPSAVQERGAEEVSTREPTETGAGVGKKVPPKREPPAKGETLKAKGKAAAGGKAPPVRETGKAVKEERPTPPKKEKAYASPKEAWADMKPDDAPAFSELSAVQQAEWIVLYENDGMTIDLANQIAKSRTKVVIEDKAQVDSIVKRIRAERTTQEDGAGVSDAEVIATLIERVETTRFKRDYQDSISNLIEWLYSVDSNQKRAGFDKLIYDFLNDLPIDDAFRGAVVDFARLRRMQKNENDSGKIKATSKDGNYTPVFQLILKAGMLDPVRQKFGFDSLPADLQLADENTAMDPDTDEQMPTDLPESDPLADEKDNNIGEDWDKEDGAFFRDDGQPISRSIDIGRVRMTVQNFVAKLTLKPRTFVFRNQADLKAKDPTLYAQAVAARPQGDFDRTSAVAYSFGGTPPAAPIGVSRRQFLQGIGAAVVAAKANLGGMNKKELWDQFFVAFDKLGSAINSAPESLSDTKVYELLKADPLASRIQRGYDTDDPAVWERFSLAYEDFENTGDTDFFPDITEEEVIKSRRVIESAIESIQKITQKEAPKAEAKPVPPTVIIFSDRVRTEQQLNFVLAHESVGHLGFRALVPQNKFDALMNQIYDLSPAIRVGVDAAMEVRGLPKSEAVEEYLADFAAELDVSLVARIWNAIKGALNKLGVKFGDEAARYFIDQSRRYVRNGNVGSLFTVQNMISRLQAIENGFDPDNTGRFANTSPLRDVNILAGGLMSDNGLPMSIDDAIKQMKNTGVNLGGSFDAFKAKVFDLLAFRARENAGLDQLEKIMSEGRDISMSIKVAMKEQMAVALNRAVTDAAAGFKFIGGTTQAQLDSINKFLYDGMRRAISKFDPKSIGNVRLYTVAEDGTLKADEAEIERLYNLGTLTLEQMRDGFTYQVTFEREGETVKESVKVEGIPGLTEESPEWLGYVAARKTMRDVELRLLKARYLAYTQDRDLSFRELTEFLSDEGKDKNGKMISSADQFLNRMYRKYRELWTEEQIIDENGDVQFNSDSIERANEFIKALNTAIIANESAATDKVAAERNAKVAEFFPKVQPDSISKSIEDFKEIFNRTDESEFAVQNKLKDLIISDLANDQADRFVKQTLATGYVPLLRRGQFEVRVQAFDSAGNPVVLKQDYKDQLSYRQFEDEAEALEIAKAINNDLFGDQTYKVEILNRKTGKYELQSVKLRAITSTALDAVAAPPQLNLNEFTRGLRQFNIVLRPEKLEQVIVALTRQNNRARQRLMRRDVPGADPDAIRAVTEHVESRASTIAKVHMRPRINELMNLNMLESRRLWNGDKAQLDKLRQEWQRLEADPNANSAEKEYAKRLYDRYAFMYAKTNPPGRATQGNKYFNEASQLLQFMENNRDLNESDFGAGEVASSVRAATSIMQLGGSIATGALNYIGAITNAVPFLATYNPQSSFGGGFGFGASFREFMVALNQVGLIKSISDSRLNTAEYYDQIAASPQLQKQYGLKDHEAKFIATEIREGTMIPAQLNALTETARGRIKSAPLQKAIEGFMWTFNATEQSSRRGIGLAAYRLEYARRKSAGLTDEKAAEFARQFAVDTMKLSLGEYSVINRPAMWRSGLQSFLYMYKVFPTTTIMLLSRLPRKGQIYMLASLLLLAGISGMPFAEDLEDIIDTIAQKLGFKSGSIRFELAKAIDAIVPGASTLFISGASSYLLPADVAGRVSLGNFIPGTGILLAGSNTGREAAEIAGPAFSMITGTFTSGLTAVRAATSEQVTLEDWLRENPLTLARLFGDSLAYAQSGAVVDRRGYVVSAEGSTAAIITRLLGFYPASAANEYSIIRISKRITDYQKEVTAGFRQGWIKANIEGDPERARAIEEAVREWNSSAAGTGLEINNFVQNSRRALREAQRPAKERLLRAAPKASKQDLEQVAQLLGY